MRGLTAGKELVDAARAFISKLALRNGTYPPDSYPNPGRFLPAIAGRRLTRMATSALGFHYAQLEATAFREEFDTASFQDHTLPKNNTIHKKAGPLIKEWTKLLQNDESANAVIVEAGSKRKAVSPRCFFFFSFWIAGADNAQDVSLPEAEVRSRYETGGLMQVRVAYMCRTFSA